MSGAHYIHVLELVAHFEAYYGADIVSDTVLNFCQAEACRGDGEEDTVAYALSRKPYEYFLINIICLFLEAREVVYNDKDRGHSAFMNLDILAEITAAEELFPLLDHRGYHIEEF